MTPNRLLAFAACLALALAAPAAQAMQLITEAEAKLPNDTTQSRGLSRGPRVLLVNPAPTAGLIQAPFDLKVKFESFGGARVDPDSVVVTYKKMPSIDLTQRMKKLIAESGITLDGVEVPPGEHYIRIDVSDTGGRKGWTEFVLKVNR
jgi:hypothetical protein